MGGTGSFRLHGKDDGGRGTKVGHNSARFAITNLELETTFVIRYHMTFGAFVTSTSY